MIERQRVARLQIRLVEAGEREAGARRHEQRVQELVVAVQRIVAGHEIEGDLVGAGLGHLGGDDDVPVANSGRDDAASGANGRQPLGRLGEVEDQLLGLLE